MGNPYSESFHSRLRDEFLNRESFASLLEAKVLAKEFGTITIIIGPFGLGRSASKELAPYHL